MSHVTLKARVSHSMTTSNLTPSPRCNGRRTPKKIVKTVPRKQKQLITDHSDEPEEGSDHDDHIFMFHDSLKTDHALEAEGVTSRAWYCPKSASEYSDSKALAN